MITLCERENELLMFISALKSQQIEYSIIHAQVIAAIGDW